MAHLLQMWWSLKKYGRWTEIAVQLMKAERAVLEALTLVIHSLREAAAPYTKDDPFAAVLHEIFRFLENLATALLPQSEDKGASETEAVRETQRRALLAIRDVLLEERTSVTLDPGRGEFRSQVIDSILNVIDLELDRAGFDDIVEDDEAPGMADLPLGDSAPALS